ncbi:MAG: PstS family phosphate ABC transporter substrate-binding protein [Leptolinea sp.]|jgi:phosphate transport system substrate-binding protein|nr:PstS family phosphate ABC transporter substrate-binding protein [Leptolinea sp.]
MRSKIMVVLSILVISSLFMTGFTTAAPDGMAAAAVTPTAVPANSDVKEIELPDVDPSALKGDIYSAGSSTVGPLSEAIQELFVQDGFSGEIKNDIIGSGGGFERFCKTGETDVANASRKIKDEEIANCAKLNPARKPIAFRVGTDAITIVVNKKNEFLKNVTTEELGKIFSTAEKWSDVNSKWPAQPIKRFTPGTDSGTFDFFAEIVIQKPQKLEKLDDAKKLLLNAKNNQASEDDNVLVQGVEGDPYAIGYFGFAYYQQQKDRLNAVSVNEIAPSFETAESGKYLLSRPLFIYSDAAIMKAKPQVAGFINYYLTNVDKVIDKVGYFPASTEALNQAKQAFLDATK